MRACWAGILIVLAAVLAAPVAWGQTPPEQTPTPPPMATPTPESTPTPEEIEEAERKERLRKRRIVRRVYADFQRDARIDNCDHTRTALERTLESISEEFDTDFPDFREAVRAAIKDHDKERCEREREEAQATPTPSPTTSASPPPTTTSPPAATSPPPVSTDSGDVPDFDSGATGGSSGNSGGGTPTAPKTPPPSESDITPVQPEATPAPTVVPPTTAAPQLAVVRPDGDSNLLLPAILLAAALAGLGLLGASALAARRSGHLAGWGHSLREASYRASGAWGDFGDWLRLGR